MTRLSARIVLLTALLAALAVAPATAQPRWQFDAPIFLGLAEDGLLVTIAPASFAGCTVGYNLVVMQGRPELDLWSVVLVPDGPLFETRLVVTGKGTLNFKWENDVWIRVFSLADGDLDTYLANPCAFYGSHPYVAEGLGRMNYTSADDSLSGPGVMSWGWVIKGDLDSEDGYCPAGTSPLFSWVQRWVNRSGSDYYAAKSTASRGPTLTCR
jgi:hypothetical protein